MKCLLPFVFAMLLPFLARAADVSGYTLVLKEHRYQPGELHIPANTRIRLEVINQDPSPEEFESDDFPAEKIVMPNSRISLFIGPLKPGRYRFYGDFHQPTAQGALVVE
ncbi:MAG: cupredoxin domain-containing protein [Rhodanobacter sp.]